MSNGVVIVGAGQAGFQAAVSLRSDGFEEPIKLIGEEVHLPYQRPPLSKGFLAGKQEIESAALRPERFYEDHRIDLMLGEKVAGIDRAGRRVTLASGTSVPFEKLILATGARVREIPISGASYLRHHDDAVELKRRVEGAKNIVIIGGGFIGLEVASVARSLGKRVLVVEAQPRLMARCVAPIISDFYRELHIRQGVDVSLGEVVSKGSAREVSLGDGTIHPADLILAGIGVVPNVELAEDADLPVDNGILVDDHLRTEDENIFAIGDCANHPNPFAGGRVRIESVQNAVDQGKCVAAQIAGRPEPYIAVPWFWTDQFDVKLQMAGLSNLADRAVTRGAEDRKFSVFYFKEDRLIAIDSINRPADHMAGRKLLTAGTRLTPEQAADESFDLKSLFS